MHSTTLLSVMCDIGYFPITIITLSRLLHYHDYYTITIRYHDNYTNSLLSLCIYTDDTCSSDLLEVQYNMVHDWHTTLQALLSKKSTVNNDI